MTTLTYTDMTMRARSRSHGLVRTACERLLGLGTQSVRRPAFGVSIHADDLCDLAEIERRSLFDMMGPERR